VLRRKEVVFLTKVDEQVNVACPDNSGITSVMLAPPVPYGILLTGVAG
jgi:hypothetical protein